MQAQKINRFLTKIIAFADIWISAKILPLQVHSKDFQGVLELAEGSPVNMYRHLSPKFISKCVMKSTFRPWLMRDRRCLRRSIVCYRFLRKSGHLPQIHFSVDHKSLNSDKTKAHCWVALDGEEVVEGEIAQMTLIYTYPGEVSNGQG